MAQASALRNQVGQLLGAIRVLAHLRKQGSDPEIAEIEGCFNPTLTAVIDGRRLDRVLLRHRAVLEAAGQDGGNPSCKAGRAGKGGNPEGKRGRKENGGPPPSENPPPAAGSPRTPLGQISANRISAPPSPSADGHPAAHTECGGHVRAVL
jgi:hypothetical protein